MTNTPTASSTSNYVFHRGLVMALLSVRFTIEFTTQSRGILDSEDVYIVPQMNHILDSSLALRNMLTPNEALLMKKNIGEWPNEILKQMSWHSEACGCLLWSVGELTSFPSLYEPFGFELLNTYFHGMTSLKWVIPFSQRDVGFRDKDEILRRKKHAEIVFQRCLFSNTIRHKGKAVPLKTYDSIFHFSEIGLPLSPSGDLIIFDKEFCDLSEAEEQAIFPVAASRAQAFSFVTNPNQHWDEMNLDYLYKLPE